MTKIKLLDIVTGDNTRDKIEKAGLKELASSIESVGLLQPIVVKKEGKKYRLVAGRRRYEAIKMLKWEEVPITEIETEDLKEVQITENLQREQLNPIEEANAIKELFLTKEIKEIAKILGKSTKYIAERRSLTNLIPLGRSYLLKKKMRLSAAIELSKYPEKLQKEYLEDRTVEFVDVDSIQRYMIRDSYLLSKAGFQIDKEYKGLRLCEGCPFRSSNSPDLFNGKKDLCMDIECYQKKEEIELKAKIEDLTARGVEVQWVGDSSVKSRMERLGLKAFINHYDLYTKKDLEAGDKKKLEKYEKSNGDQRKNFMQISSPGAGKVFKAYLNSDLSVILKGKEKESYSQTVSPKQTPEQRYKRRLELSEIRQVAEAFKSYCVTLANTQVIKNLSPFILFFAKETIGMLRGFSITPLTYYLDLDDNYEKAQKQITEMFEKLITKKEYERLFVLSMLVRYLQHRSVDPESLVSDPLVSDFILMLSKEGIENSEELLAINTKYSEARAKITEQFNKRNK